KRSRRRRTTQTLKNTRQMTAQQGAAWSIVSQLGKHTGVELLRHPMWNVKFGGEAYPRPVVEISTAACLSTCSCLFSGGFPTSATMRRTTKATEGGGYRLTSITKTCDLHLTSTGVMMAVAVLRVIASR